MKNSPTLRDYKIADRVRRRFDTWRGDILFADVESSLEDNFDVLVLDYGSSELAVDMVNEINFDIPNLMAEVCDILESELEDEKEWGYQVNSVFSSDSNISREILNGNVYYDDRSQLEKLKPVHEKLFGKSLGESNYSLINRERWDNGCC